MGDDFIIESLSHKVSYLGKPPTHPLPQRHHGIDHYRCVGPQSAWCKDRMRDCALDGADKPV